MLGLNQLSLWGFEEIRMICREIVVYIYGCVRVMNLSIIMML